MTSSDAVTHKKHNHENIKETRNTHANGKGRESRHLDISRRGHWTTTVLPTHSLLGVEDAAGAVTSRVGASAVWAPQDGVGAYLARIARRREEVTLLTAMSRGDVALGTQSTHRPRGARACRVSVPGCSSWSRDEGDQSRGSGEREERDQRGTHLGARQSRGRPGA